MVSANLPGNPNPGQVAAADQNHPDWLGAFMLRAHEDDRVTCDHCGRLYPCPAALDRHKCEDSSLCRMMGECAFRAEWAPNLARGGADSRG